MISRFILVHLVVLIFALPLSASAVCVGVECSSISNQTYIGANLIEPLLGEIYTKEFLSSMGQSAVLQNINSIMMGGTLIEKNRIAVGYSMAKSSLAPRDFYFENSELRVLPTQGISASPSFTYAANLGHILEKKGEWAKWNIHIQFFPYYLSENNVPLLKIRNTDVGGKVFNFGVNARYFPFYQCTETSSRWGGLSLGFGIYHTSQEILLSSYDRRPTQFQVDGDRRRWLGVNGLRYDSRIHSGSTDIRYSYSYNGISIFGGLGFLYNQGYTNVKVNRIAAISSTVNRDDFVTNPSAVSLELNRKYEVRHSTGYAVIGLQYRWSNVSFGLEYLRNKASESANLSVQYHY